MAGLKPNDFHWIIEGKLAVSECIGGGGLTPRKIRREEEIQWLKGQGINAIFSLLDSDFNLKNYQEVGFRTYHYPLNDDIPKESLNVIFDAIKEALSDKDRKLLNIITSEEDKFWKFISSKKFLNEERVYANLSKRIADEIKNMLALNY